MPRVRTDAEHRALDERLTLLGWGLVLVILALMLLLPGVHALWWYLIPVGLILAGMSGVRRLLRTRRDTDGLVIGSVAVVVGLLSLTGIDLRFFPLVPVLFAAAGLALTVVALFSRRLRRDPTRPAQL